MPVDPDDVGISIRFGTIEHPYDDGSLSMSLLVRGNGEGKIVVTVQEGKRRQSSLMILGLDQYNELRRMMKKADETIKQLSREKRLTSM